MQYLRLILVNVVFLGLSYYLGKNVFIGLKTGIIRYTYSQKICKRNERPFFYWFLVILFTTIICFCIHLAFNCSIDVLNKI